MADLPLALALSSVLAASMAPQDRAGLLAALRGSQPGEPAAELAGRDRPVPGRVLLLGSRRPVGTGDERRSGGRSSIVA